ncbi:MAG: cardiolipin synthase [Candidatus Cloacimonas sp.]
MALLISLVLIASLTQLIVGGSVLETFSKVTLRIINILFGISIVLVILIVVMENGSPATTMAWILVLIFLPIVGFILYLFFGRNWRKKRLFSKKGYADIQNLITYIQKYPLPKENNWQTELSARLNKLLENNSKATLTINNDVTLYSDTLQAFKAILEGIASARYFVHLEYFSINADETGYALQKLLIQKAMEGVEIRFIYDDVGCWMLKKSFKNELRNAGVEFVPFMPVWIPFLNSRLNYRNHRKLVIVDGKKAYLGGLNIGDKYLGRKRYYGYWRDSLAEIEGQAALALQAIFLTDWDFVTGKNLMQECLLDKYLPVLPAEKQYFLPMQIVANGPDSDYDSIMQLYFAAITYARNNIRISTPYLVLNESLLSALKIAAISKVKIQILVPDKPDHFLVFWASRSYFQQLLDVGVEIWTYHKGFNHSKTLIVDEEVLLIGTANMDMRSFNQNFELAATIYDKNVCLEAIHQFEEDLKYSSKLDPEKFQQRSMVQKTKESICRLVSPLL